MIDSNFYEIVVKKPFNEIEFYVRLRKVNDCESDYDFKILRDIVKLMCKSYPLEMGNTIQRVFFKCYSTDYHLDIGKILMIL